MNLSSLLQARAAASHPVRVGLIGCGKFASMFLTQAIRTPGLQVAAIADLAPARARATLARIGWEPERLAPGSLSEAVRNGGTWLTAHKMYS